MTKPKKKTEVEVSKILIRDFSEFLGTHADANPEKDEDLPQFPSREEVLKAASRGLGPNVSFPESDGRVDVARVHMTVSDANTFENELEPFVVDLIEVVKSGKLPL